jgi:hypothetical protein
MNWVVAAHVLKGAQTVSACPEQEPYCPVPHVLHGVQTPGADWYVLELQLVTHTPSCDSRHEIFTSNSTLTVKPLEALSVSVW